jgi:hypothetical protein
VTGSFFLTQPGDLGVAIDLSTDLSVDILISVFLDLRLVQQMTKRNVF